MSTLHTVNKSPFETSTLKSCLEHVSDGDTILLIEDGVYGAMAGSSMADLVTAKTKAVSIIALAPDMQARGIDEDRLIKGINTTDYAGFVDLAAKNDLSHAWL